MSNMTKHARYFDLMTLIKIILAVLFLLLGSIALYTALGIGLGNIPTHAKAIAAPKDHTIYLESNGVHVDFIVPNAYLIQDELLATLSGATGGYTAFGWGDKAFYLETPRWQDLTVTNFLRAAFWKSDSLMHVSRFRGYGEARDWVPVHLSEAQVSDLLHYIRADFVVHDGAPMVIPEASYYGTDRFYKAHGSYTLFYTCNHWVNEGLSVIGESTALWSPFDGPLLEHARRNAESAKTKTGQH